MARGINKVILIGRLGSDPEVRYMPSGAAACNISLATTETRKDRESGATQEHTEWHRLTFYNRLAEITHQYLRKGSQIYVEGRLRTRKWADKNGQERMTTEIIVEEMQMLDSKSASSSGFSSGATPSSASSHAESSVPEFEEDFSDDVPF